jgi:hypothetical protein
MSDDWQPGDLALCVRGGRLTARLSPLDEYPCSGRIYVVHMAGETTFAAAGLLPALWLLDGPPNNNGERCWATSRFRKIRPHKPDAEDAETIRLLNGERVPA